MHNYGNNCIRYLVLWIFHRFFTAKQGHQILFCSRCPGLALRIVLFLFASLVALERALPHHGSLHHCTLKFSLHSPSTDSVTMLSLTSPRCAPASKISLLSGGIIRGLFRPKESTEVKNNRTMLCKSWKKKVAIRISLYMLWKQHGYSFTEEQEKSKFLSTGCFTLQCLPRKWL